MPSTMPVMVPENSLTVPSASLVPTNRDEPPSSSPASGLAESSISVAGSVSCN